MKLPIGDINPYLFFLLNGRSVQFHSWRRKPDRGEGEVCVDITQGGTLIIDVTIEGGEVDFGEKATPLLV